MEQRRRLRINVSGQYFETTLLVLERHPDTLLGDRRKRSQFFDRAKNEFFFDRHRPSFEAIFLYYQYGGRLRRPPHVPDDVFLDELLFYQLESDVVDEYKRSEGYTSEVIHLPSNVTLRRLWMLFEYPETSRAAFVIAILSVAVTLISIVLFCVETLPVFAMTHCVAGEMPNFLDAFFLIKTSLRRFDETGTRLTSPVCEHRTILTNSFDITLPYRDNVHSVVHRRGDRTVHRVPVQVGVLARLQKHSRRRGRSAVLRDALQRPVHDELRGRQVERFAGLLARHPFDPRLQTDETFRRTSGADVDIPRKSRRPRALSGRALRLPARLFQRHLLRRARSAELADSQHPGRVLVGYNYHDDGWLRGQGSSRLLG